MFCVSFGVAHRFDTVNCNYVLFCLIFVIEFEGLAQQGTKSERRIAPGEAQFLWKLIQAHGDNYKVDLCTTPHTIHTSTCLVIKLN